MELKDYFIKEFTKHIAQVQESLNIVRKTRMEEADYRVEICSSLKAEGEENTITEHHGTLKDAIQKAEEEFKETNNRDDIHGDYFPRIVLGKESYPIPKMFWEQYIGRED